MYSSLNTFKYGNIKKGLSYLETLIEHFLKTDVPSVVIEPAVRNKLDAISSVVTLTVFLLPMMASKMQN